MPYSSAYSIMASKLSVHLFMGSLHHMTVNYNLSAKQREIVSQVLVVR